VVPEIGTEPERSLASIASVPDQIRNLRPQRRRPRHARSFHHIDGRYLEQNTKVVDEQLLKGGLRLARLINEALGGS
jgi:hypothetical protein